jgi:anaerobic ribonucleoside-triphosphate reductase
MFTKLTTKQIEQKISFINAYLDNRNASDSSIFDSNANVVIKNIATLENEINKDINIQINRKLVSLKIEQLFGKQLAVDYIRQIENHEIYIHDETSFKPYCASISMYPLLVNGLRDLGGEHQKPLDLQSFCSMFVNLVFAVASQFAGAIATVEFLMYFDYFARKDFGEDYINNKQKDIEKLFQHVVYSINQPAAARGYQSVFWNISIYDKEYFEGMFENFHFPDFSKPKWHSINLLQKFFMKWFNKERNIALLTYPVITAACLIKDSQILDKEFEDFIVEELSEGNSFFIFINENPNALSSCCRLKNNIKQQRQQFSYSLGAGGVSTGSLNVITINLNRIIQQNIDLKTLVQKIHQYQLAHRKIIEDYLNANMLPVYNAGFISIDQQYLTIGINGLVEAAEFLGHIITPNEKYMHFVESVLKTINKENKIAEKKYNFKFNTEFVPAENLGIKNAQWDKDDNLLVNRDCYNSYLYKVEDRSISILDKFILHGKRFMKYLDGGSAYHCNLEDYPTKETFKKLLSVAAKEGCEYFCFNIKMTLCNLCQYIDKRTLSYCKKCGTNNVDHATRIIGYLKKISNFSTQRQKESALRFYKKL